MRKLYLLGIRYLINLLAVFSKKQAGKVALKLFFTPRAGHLKPQDRAFLETAQWGQVTARGFNVQYYLWEGSGPTVLLAHGWESNSARWRTLIEKLLEHHFRVLAIDAPAHGGSGSPQFSAVLYAHFIAALLRHQPADYAVAHSAGAMGLAYYETHQPEHPLKKIVLLGAPSTLRAILDLYTGMVNISRRAKESVDEGILHKFGNPVEYYAIEDMAYKLTTDCLIIHDEHDNTAPFAGAERIHRNWRGSRLIRTSGLGHSVQSDAVNEAIIAFLETS